MSTKELFLLFYWKCCRHEAEFGWNLKISFLKRFPHTEGVHQASEEQFNELLKLCRLISREFPEALSIDNSVSYQDPLDKVIGKHDFAAKLNLSHAGIENLFQNLANKLSRSEKDLSPTPSRTVTKSESTLR